MAIYRIKEKFWWWDAYYTIQDEDGKVMYSLHRKWFAMDQAIEIKDEQASGGGGGEKEEEPESQGGSRSPAETVMTIRKKVLLSWGPGVSFELIRNDNVVVACIKKKKVHQQKGWFQKQQQQERHVFELADVDYVVDESKWTKNKSFSIHPPPTTTKNKAIKEEDSIAHVYKKRFDWSGTTFWVDIKVDPNYYEGQALKDMCVTVLAACISMIEILTEQDRQIIKLQQEEKRLKDKIIKQQQQQQQQIAP